MYEKQIDINGTQRSLVIVDTAASDDYVALRDYDCLHGDALLLCCDLQIQVTGKHGVQTITVFTQQYQT